MNSITIRLSRLAVITAASALAAACVFVMPIPGKTDGDATKKDAPKETSAELCNIEGTQTQDLSDGTTKAFITQSCAETVVTIENKHDKHSKRCRVSSGTKVSELYVRPGESRKYVQSGPVKNDSVKVSCVNDWNRPK